MKIYVRTIFILVKLVESYQVDITDAISVERVDTELWNATLEALLSLFGRILTIFSKYGALEAMTR
jgi:hypothetical protein